MTEIGVFLIGLMVGFLAGWVVRGFLAIKDMLVLEKEYRILNQKGHQQ